MDKSHHPPAATPGYETRDATAPPVFKFLAVLGIVLVASFLVCWGMFRFLSAHAVDQPATDSPFADSRQLPMGPQLQVNPREDWLKFREDQEKSLQTYAWENRTAGTVRVPIEEAMDLLVKRGVPVQGVPQTASTSSDSSKPAAEGKKKQ
jgi:hypothetical protein